MKDALATSEKVSGIGAKLFSFILLVAPPGITAAIGIKYGFTLRDWLGYPAMFFLLWLFFLMLLAAFSKHQKQQAIITSLEGAKKIKLEIDGISYQGGINGPLCRVTVRNISSGNADNVHVRVSGQLVPKIFADGYSPFNEPDLQPASGSRSINPGATADWLFSESFNQLAFHFERTSKSINVVNILFNQKTEEPTQVFSITASASDSPPLMVKFDIIKENFKLVFRKLGQNQPS